VPVAVAIGLTGLVAVYIFTDFPLFFASNTLFHSLNSYVLIAFPLFFLAGNIMGTGGLAKRLIKICQVATAPIAGGLAIAMVLACAVFASITGSSTTGLVAIGTIMFPALTKAKYDKSFSSGLLTTSGSLGILIPPSIPMIFYAYLADQSVGKMFLAGIGPGLLITILLCVYAHYFAKQKKYTYAEFKFLDLLKALKAGLWAIGMPFIILGGIYGGVFTVTEAAGVAVIYAAFVELFIYKELKWQDLLKILDETTLFVASIAIIVSMASFFGQYLALERIPDEVAIFFQRFITSKMLFLVVINCLLLFVGTFMDIISAMVILVPLLLPLATRYQVDLVHLGIIFVINMEIGFMTPPLGLNLFASQMITKMTFDKVIKAVLPTLLILLLVLIFVTYFSQLALFIPSLYYAK
jgi:C4-dicarboxylate transporter DctM subunit